MSGGDWKTIGRERMRPVLVDLDGQLWAVTSPFFWMRPRQPDGNLVDYAVTKLGFIHIWPVDDSSIVVALQPDLVHAKTMTAAFYAIADLQPTRVYISSTNMTKQRWEFFRNVHCALRRIERLVIAAHRSSIAVRLMRVWQYLRKTDDADAPHARKLWRACKSREQRSDTADPVARLPRVLCRSPLCRGTLTIVAVALAALS